MNVKDFGQVFTPEHIVKDILNIAGYKSGKILGKHIIDNSCGDGAFLIEIVKRYVKEYKKVKNKLEGIETEIEKYIHGIEIDKEIYAQCISNLEKLRKELNLKEIKWNILNENTLLINDYNEKMDYVVGNPPYVRVHNLKEQYDKTKEYKFSSKGMTDLYIVFFEIGFNMLSQGGILCYITPNSFYNSLAAETLRKYIIENKNLNTIVDLGHYQPFSVTTYTAISKYTKGKKYKTCKYYKYNEEEKPEYVRTINYKDLFIDGKIVLDNNENKEILSYLPRNQEVIVKNAFATLGDKIFIKENFDFNTNVIDIIKASTGEWKKCIYPYDNNGNIIEFEELGEREKEYLLENEKDLRKRSLEKRTKWYGFGRSQAINDVQKNRIAINTIVRDVDSIKMSEVEPGQGIYSGLYILTDRNINEIRDILMTEEFIEYIKMLNKCKSGGYYTFSSQDLAKYLNYKLEEE